MATLVRAMKLLDYFNYHKLILSAYDIEPGSRFSDVFNDLNPKEIISSPVYYP